MCGIAGFFNNSENTDSNSTIQSMLETLLHRGPDDSGIWTDSNSRLVLGQRRLSIIDLSSDGRQPMISASGRYVIVFNGEIYNFRELRVQLSDYPYRGNSDTEVMLASFDRWGIKDAVSKFTGMFAFAAYDLANRILYLFRDRMGEKPLYYGRIDSSFVFASELKALRRFPNFNNKINKKAEDLFFQFSYVPTPLSIYENIFKLPAGKFLEIQAPTKADQVLEPKTYWDPQSLSTCKTIEISESHAVVELEKLLSKKISQQIISDVPIGAFLSGGVDSSIIAALMQRQCSKPINTFTIGFGDAAYDESKKAEKIAQYLKTHHTQIIVNPDDALKLVPDLPKIYDEPFADSSQLPTVLLCKMAKKHVTVALSGDGGDEVFGGYNRYFWAPQLWQALNAIPPSLRTWLVDTFAHVQPSTWDKILGIFQEKTPGEKISKLLRSIPAKTDFEFYTRLSSHFISDSTRLNPPSTWNNIEGFARRMMIQDLTTYLSDDILVKVDRAGMSQSLETRIPYLDHEISEFMWRLPLHFRMRDGTGKWILKELASELLPKNILAGPKQGFAVPLDSWLRGPLKEWSQDLISRFEKNHEIAQKLDVRRLWNEHQSGQSNWQYFLWDVVIYQSWTDHWS